MAEETVDDVEDNDDCSFSESDLDELVVQKRFNIHKKESDKNLLLKIKTKYNKQPHLSRM